MKLGELLTGVKVRGKFDPNIEIERLSYDSRQVEPGDLFVAIRGRSFNGANFIAEALKRGAIAVVSERIPEEVKGDLLLVESARYALAILSANFYAHPDRKLALVGVTGTNGKTAVTHLLAHIFNRAGVRAAAVGTLGCLKEGVYLPLRHTTPEAPELYGLLAGLVSEDYRFVAMEVSSHGLAENRVAGIKWRGALFTNLTQDHLNFHGDMEQYYLAKRRLFESLSEGSFGVVNIDDSYGKRLFDEFGGDFIAISLHHEKADYRITDYHLSSGGSEFNVMMPRGRSVSFSSPLLGRFNLYNALFAIAVADIFGLEPDTIAVGLATYRGVSGRLEPVEMGQPFGVYIDYAHTPDALRNTLETLRQITTGRLIVVFGCGGDRDREKRPIMGSVAARIADRVIVTSDNPRSESPESIIDEIVAGIPEGSDFEAIVSRREAIELALSEAKAGDILLIAGKGHETYQIIASEKLRFSDREVVCELLRERGYSLE